MQEKKGNTGWAVLGFFLPIVGLILWLVWKNSRPEDSHQAGKGALIGVIVYAVFIVVSIIFAFTVFGSVFGGIMGTM